MKYLFVCIENAGRSQAAEAFAKSMGLEAMSAGTIPAKEVNPVIRRLLEARGIVAENMHPKLLNMDMIGWADFVVTMGCSIESVCPAVIIDRMNVKKIAWNIEDPKGKSEREVARILDEIEEKVKSLKLSMQSEE
jgi:protein-tyrosine-phosphatase